MEELKMQRTSSKSDHSEPGVESVAPDSPSTLDSSEHSQTGDIIANQGLNLVPQPSPPAKKIRQLRCRVIFWVVMVILTAFSSQYIYQVLLADHPHVGRLFFSPTNTNLAITIIAQVFAQLIQSLFIDIFDVLRWQLASQERGVPVRTFLQLSGCTRWLGLLCLIVVRGSHHIWGIHRLLLPFIAIFIGGVLKIDATFEDRVTATNSTVQVFAGLAPMDKRVLEYIPTSVMCIYYLAWIPSVLGVAKYATGISPTNCTGNCTSVFLPGGLELARVFGQNLNATLFEQGIIGDSDAVLLNNASGIGLEFSSPYDGFEFDIENDCQLYGTRNDSVQICLTTNDSSLIVGWNICPTAIFRAQQCATNNTWSSSQPKQQTSLSTFRQSATTVYERQNLSIISFETVSPPEPYALDPNDFKAIWAKLFDPGPDPISDDAIMVSAFMYEMGWYLRLYEDQFSDDGQDPLNLLQNFLTIPIQFSTTALQFSNASLEAALPGSGMFPMPSELEATASAAQITPRFTGQLWTVCTFIAVCSVLVLWAGCILGWILFNSRPLLTDPSAFPEWDVVSKSACDTEHESTRPTLSEFAQEKGLTNASSWAIQRAMRGKRAQVIEVQYGGQRTYYLLLVEPEGIVSENEVALRRLAPS